MPADSHPSTERLDLTVDEHLHVWGAPLPEAVLLSVENAMALGITHHEAIGLVMTRLYSRLLIEYAPAVPDVPPADWPGAA